MHPRAAALIRELHLHPHPEGGYFREIFRSAEVVQPLDQRPTRSALTTIYFLLVRGQHSRWHRVASDEVWHFYEGEPLDLFWIDQEDRLQHEVLSDGSPPGRHVAVVPASRWQAARPTGSYSLVGCTVGPGFDFHDFEMISDTSQVGETIRRIGGIASELI